MRCDLYDVAVSLGSTMRDLSWSDMPCSEFVRLAIEKQIAMLRNDPSYRLPAAIGERVNMSDVPRGGLADLVERNDARIHGAPGAIVQAGMGRMILDPEDAVRGDVVQWWRRTRGVWAGHAFVIDSVVVESSGLVYCKAYGSHRSLNGVGLHPQRFALDSDDRRRVWIARMDSERIT